MGTSAAKFKSKPRQLLRKAVYERDNFSCKICGWRPSKIPPNYDGAAAIGESWMQGREDRFLVLELDHIIPRDHGGKTLFDNLQTLCTACNSHKGTKTHEEAVAAKKPYLKKYIRCV